MDDVNSDGKRDLLVGDSVALVAIAAGLDKDEFDAKWAQWQKNSAKISDEFRADGADERKLGKLREKMQALYSQRSEFMTERQTGFVWLDLQK